MVLPIRPTMIGTEPTLGIGPASEVELFVILSPVGPYFSSGFEPVNLLADPNFVRSWPGGSGYSKMGSNYAPTIYVGVSNFYFLHYKSMHLIHSVAKAFLKSLLYSNTKVSLTNRCISS